MNGIISSDGGDNPERQNVYISEFNKSVIQKGMTTFGRFAILCGGGF